MLCNFVLLLPKYIFIVVVVVFELICGLQLHCTFPVLEFPNCVYLLPNKMKLMYLYDSIYFIYAKAVSQCHFLGRHREAPQCCLSIKNFEIKLTPEMIAPFS